MITCPWCGTSYPAFQSNCSRCGGSIPPPHVTEGVEETLLAPPGAPRDISSTYAFRLMLSDGWSIASLALTLIGAIFTGLGLALTLAIVTAFVGIPFLLLGLVFFIPGAAVLFWRYREFQKQVLVLKWGDAILGSVAGLQENYSVMVDDRHPWSIDYHYEVGGYQYSGKLSTLNQPGDRLQPGRQVYVLYSRDNPGLSSLYPRP